MPPRPDAISTPCQTRQWCLRIPGALVCREFHGECAIYCRCQPQLSGSALRSSLQGAGRKGEWEVALNRDGQVLSAINVDYVCLELTLPGVLRVPVSLTVCQSVIYSVGDPRKSLTDVSSEDLHGPPSVYMMLSMSFIPSHRSLFEPSDRAQVSAPCRHESSQRCTCLGYGHVVF